MLSWERRQSFKHVESNIMLKFSIWMVVSIIMIIELQYFAVFSHRFLLLLDADRANDTRSADRLLDKPLYLLVKQKLGTYSPWVFPQGLWREGESMREVSESLKARLKSCMQVFKTSSLSLHA